MAWLGRRFAAKRADWPRWARHWDPHPMCWLGSVLRTQPYEHRGVGMRPCVAEGGVAVTLPHSYLVVGATPVDGHRVVWRVHTQDPVRPNDHQEIVFGEFTWTAVGDRYDGETGLIGLPDGSTLNVPDGRSKGGGRYRIESRAQPGRLIPATDTWADLAAIERIATEVHGWLLSGSTATGAATGDVR